MFLMCTMFRCFVAPIFSHCARGSNLQSIVHFDSRPYLAVPYARVLHMSNMEWLMDHSVHGETALLPCMANGMGPTKISYLSARCAICALMYKMWA
jgi:hypothetical protein